MNGSIGKVKVETWQTEEKKGKRERGNEKTENGKWDKGLPDDGGWIDGRGHRVT